MDFGRFLEASWEGKGAKIDPKRHPKIRWKKEGVLKASWERLASQNPPNINLTRHGTGSALLFKGSLMQKPCGATLYRTCSSRSRRSFKKCTSTPPKIDAQTSQNRAKMDPKSIKKPSKIQWKKWQCSNMIVT